MSQSMSSKSLVWFITGTSVGIGRELTLAALQRGDKVIATARNVDKIKDLQEAGAATLPFDVTNPLETLKQAAADAVKIYGRIDVLVNNAGYCESGAIEENTPEETFKQFDTNVFGVLNTTRAILPYMRERRSGTIVMIGSMVGWTGFVNCGLYTATKFAIRGLSESLRLEIEPLGLHCLCIEPGSFRTQFLTETSRPAWESRIQDYYDICKSANDGLMAGNCKQPGDPKKLVQVLLDLVKKEGVATGKEVPGVLPLGSDVYNVVKNACEETLNNLKEWEEAIKNTDFPAGV